MQTTFDVQNFIISLLVNGGAGMIVSGWVAAKWTNASGLWMNVQTFATSLILTAAASLLGLIPIPISDFWHFVQSGVTNGVLASLLYKSGIFGNILGVIGARTNHQKAP